MFLLIFLAFRDKNILRPLLDYIQISLLLVKPHKHGLLSEGLKGKQLSSNLKTYMLLLRVYQQIVPYVEESSIFRLVISEIEFLFDLIVKNSRMMPRNSNISQIYIHCLTTTNRHHRFLMERDKQKYLGEFHSFASGLKNDIRFLRFGDIQCVVFDIIQVHPILKVVLAHLASQRSPLHHNAVILLSHIQTLVQPLPKAFQVDESNTSLTLAGTDQRVLCATDFQANSANLFLPFNRDIIQLKLELFLLIPKANCLIDHTFSLDFREVDHCIMMMVLKYYLPYLYPLSSQLDRFFLSDVLLLHLARFTLRGVARTTSHSAL